MKRIAAFTLALLALGANAAAQKVTLNKEVEKALVVSVEDELRAQAFYGAIQLKFGAQRPFSNLQRAEGQHAFMLLSVMKRYGVAAPKDTFARKEGELITEWTARLEVPKSVALAGKLAYKLEVENVEMYDKFLKLDMPNDVRQVFLNVRRASEQNHMRALSRFK